MPMIYRETRVGDEVSRRFLPSAGKNRPSGLPCSGGRGNLLLVSRVTNILSIDVARPSSPLCRLPNQSNASPRGAIVRVSSVPFQQTYRAMAKLSSADIVSSIEGQVG